MANSIHGCAPPVTSTWDGAAVNAINPAAPPPNPASLYYAWNCSDLAGAGCPPPVNDPTDSTYISFTSNTFQLDTYFLIFQVTSNGSDPNYQEEQVTQGLIQFSFTTTCIG